MDQDSKPGIEQRRQALTEEVREEIKRFDEEYPLSLGEFFGNFEQNLPGGIYRNIPGATLEHLEFLKEIDDALQKTEDERQDFIGHQLELPVETPLSKILRDLRKWGREKRKIESQLQDEKKMEELGEEIAGLRNKINELLFPPYLELRLQGFDHATITQ